MNYLKPPAGKYNMVCSGIDTGKRIQSAISPIFLIYVTYIATPPTHSQNTSLNDHSPRAATPQPMSNPKRKVEHSPNRSQMLTQAYPPPARPDYKSLLRKGRNLLDQKQFEQAFRTFASYTNVRPADPEGYFWQGIALDEMNRLELAEKAYRLSLAKVEKLGMDSPEILTNLGNVLLKENKIDQAIEIYRKAISRDPQLATAHLNLARALLEQGKAQEALESIGTCDELRFSGPQLPYYRAKALKQLGRHDAATAQAKTILMRVPEGTKEHANLINEFAIQEE